ncbi:hypothetical protein EauS123_00031 [Exiguobacterium phage vB_EauS-123]|nr:hypothetical protein EauS123_00031 [Exiguobacterium phage vB_EauS-123]
MKLSELDYAEILKKPTSEWTEEEEAYVREVTEGAIRSAKVAWAKILKVFINNVDRLLTKENLLLYGKRKRGHKNALVAYPSTIKVNRKRKRAIYKQMSKRYWQGIERAEQRGDFKESVRLFREYMNKVGGI